MTARFFILGARSWCVAIALPLLAFVAAVQPAVALDIRGAGATFPAPLYEAWGTQYERATGTHLTYTAVGSGAGLERIRAHQADFGASDMPMTQQELTRYGLLQFPTVIGGVVPVINIAGIEPGELQLTGAVLADIYLGKIRRWNDPAIQQLNPSIALPATHITVVHRAEVSGTSLLFTGFLSQSSARWHREIGASEMPRWPVGVAGNGNGGVASYVQRTRFTIGYVEYFYARDHHLSDVMLRNRSGQLVRAGRNAFRAAAAVGSWDPVHTMLQLPADPAGEHSWPITGATFVLLPARCDDPERARATLAFFDWALHAGAHTIDTADYVPVPPDVLAQLPPLWRSVTDATGKAVWP
ncbi:MAG TPA: phosphate ABC transporter substrate-binding protein PstS [Steroidobacteraceae bacterium]|nr:phosphate ABC transporter substrate-binding protein PstS [Steroidobacteraceae bacterium]